MIDPGKVVATLALIATSNIALAANTQAHESIDRYSSCLLEQLNSAKNSQTVGEIKGLCESLDKSKQNPIEVNELAAQPTSQMGLVSHRILQEQLVAKNRFGILPHKTSYILPLSYNSAPNDAPFFLENGESDLDNFELKFQFSFKTELLDSVLKDNTSLYFAYTNQSYWQHLDSDNSGPFRETNHEPELFIDIQKSFSIGSWNVPLTRFGWIHQSNGQSEILSRSWNRIFGQVMMERGNWALSFRPWIVVNGVTSEDDTQSIEDFMGNFEFGTYYSSHNNSVSMMFRNNLQSDNRGAVELNWSRPLPFSNRVRFLAQYFYGYGESLIDFDAKTNRIGIGLQLDSFL